ncbi:MAG: RdgB/HAM1 family non-canonical purine NTP pyrophosphatase [Polyangiales bacterium]
MTAKLLVATGNKGKLAELARLFAGLDLELVSLRDVAIDQDVVEDADTFHGNARKKAVELARRSGLLTLADDSGLEVDALGGAPGVLSARYAGEGAGDEANNTKLLEALRDVPDEKRTARFRCVLSLADAEGHELVHTEGACEGLIVHAPRGTNGFGYDPLFVPTGETRTMAELDPEEKHARSHRGAASRAMRDELASRVPGRRSA